MEKLEIEIKKPEDTIKIQTALVGLMNELKDGKSFDCVIKRHREKRSLNANAYFHLLVDKLAKANNISADEMKYKMVLDYGTIDTDDKGVKIGFKLREDINPDRISKYCKIIDQCVENGIKFNKIIIYKETHLYNTKEMSDLINGVVQECENLGISTKTPNEIAEMLSLWEKCNEKKFNSR